MNDLKEGESEKPLPKTEPLPGAVVAQYRVVGSKTYGPYWFRVWREKGRLRKVYVSRSNVEAVRAACLAHRRSKVLSRSFRMRMKAGDLLLGILEGYVQAERSGQAYYLPGRVLRAWGRHTAFMASLNTTEGEK